MKQLEDELYNQLITVYKKLTLEDLTHKQIRRLQYLVKTKLPKEKVKLFGLINYYKTSKNTYLKVFLHNLLNELEN